MAVSLSPTGIRLAVSARTILRPWSSSLKNLIWTLLYYKQFPTKFEILAVFLPEVQLTLASLIYITGFHSALVEFAIGFHARCCFRWNCSVFHRLMKYVWRVFVCIFLMALRLCIPTRCLKLFVYVRPLSI